MVVQWRQHGGAVVDAPQQEDSGFEMVSRLRPFCMEFACSLHAWGFSLRSSGFLTQSKDVQIRSVIFFKSPMCVNVNVSDRSSLR